jgi:uncharacterized protein
MNTSQIIQQTILFVKETLINAEGGHDWFHIERVWKNSKLIAQHEDVDLFIVELGALLHDIADAKFYDGDETVGPKIARTFLENLAVAENIIQQIEYIINNISYKSGLDKNINSGLFPKELQVVQDADRLDAIGAIGIARTFNYGGFKIRTMYDPEIPPEVNQSKETYKKSVAPTINHFYEKLLLLKDTMNTNTAKEIAQQRHIFMEQFLTQFFQEWNGEK